MMTAASAPTLTVVMPAYNEAQGIEQAVAEIQREVFALIPDAELVVVDDGSRDETGAILDRLAGEDRRVRVIHQANGGHGRAVRAGLDAASGDYILLIDSDRQIPLSAFRECWARTAGSAGVFGVRRARYDPVVRLWLTTLVRHALRLLFLVDLHDANVPFKVVRRDVWLEARAVIPDGTLAPSLFLAIFMKRYRYAVAELDVPHRARATGQSIDGWKLVRFCARAFRQLVAFRRSVR
jgi:dolichol-phosphate mannosyltransferase